MDESLQKRLRHWTRRGLEVRECDELRSYKKIIPALERFPDATLVTADDDIIYPKTWLEGLLEYHAQEPQTVICYRARQALFTCEGLFAPYMKWPLVSPEMFIDSKYIVPTGAGGVLYPPSCFSAEVLNRNAFVTLCPTADDLWLKVMLTIAGRKICCISLKEELLFVDNGSPQLIHENAVKNLGVYQDLIRRYKVVDLIEPASKVVGSKS